MAARNPRKTFATPFVVTLACLPGAACFTAESQPPQQPQPQVAPQPVPPRPKEGVIENPPRPQPAPTEPVQAGGQPTTYNFDQRWTVTKNPQGCSAMARVECPKPKKPGDPVPTCNPPPPIKIACPDGWDGKSPLTIVQYANQSECMIEPPPMKCPQGAKCNPPPPRKVACPTYQ